MKSTDPKDQLFLQVRDGATVSAHALDLALGGAFSEDPRDALLVAHWLAGEVASSSHEHWWNSVKHGAALRAIGLAHVRYAAGWGGRPEYPLTTWSFEQLHERWPSTYARVLDELVVPILHSAPSSLEAVVLAEAAHDEARLRAIALTAATLPAGLHDGGAPPPMLILLGDFYGEVSRRRRDSLFSPLEWYALVLAWHLWGEAPTAQTFALALASARRERRDPYLAMCETVLAGRWYVEPLETGARTYSVTLREHGNTETVQGGDFDTEEGNLIRAVAWTDELREYCREHNHTLAMARRQQLLTRLQAFAIALKQPQHESASALAASKAATLLDASEAVQMLRARL